LVCPNGAGKTTTIKILMNARQPTEGIAEVFGRDCRRLSPEDFTQIGYVSQNQQMPEWMTVEYFMNCLRPFYPQWDGERAQELLRQFELPPDRKIRNLSHGMRMKAALASSLAYRPRLIVLDEPFTGLDALVRDELIEGCWSAQMGRWWTLIARVIHDEALPGDSQYWTTRPYSWKSLLAAKMLFILAFINLPMLVADALIVRAHGLPLGTALPGLLWSQVLLAVVFVLPIATLSGLTTGFVQLIFAVLTPCVIALGVAVVAPEVVLGGYSGASQRVKSYYALLVIAIASSAILVWQYSRRRTAAARSMAAVAGILVLLGMTLIPLSAAFRIQSWLSKQRVEQSVGHVDFDSANGWLTRAVMEGDDRVRIELPLNVTALPPGMTAKPEGFSRYNCWREMGRRGTQTNFH
jgi:ABC-type lipoprotein export system ATPase subunit